ncbi:coatomer WD associated region-domain-containing protein [Lipomyces japonicus]|uniref:coatomer WD associated region-domain-containing protein n=1 Tax=Lipomyces japonicus TaxID=56871 RepID=UPI0034CDF093
MQMLTKFESKSSRAKGIAFHPKRPWILVSLHSSTIQLWDYRMGTLIDRFEEHDGPVRGVDFHKTQPLFVSGGDDYKIKVWSLQTRRCLFTLTGHLDYVRTVFFHHELPWIISSSDDQTIRIWNWQNRSQIACLTGHNHYTMCAQFHPKEDLIVSASLDQTVRVWDISGLRKKHSAPTSVGFEDQISRSNSNQGDMFGNTDAVVKYVLEGHDRGVNWVAFHPTLPLIISASDDRMVKLWRMSETKAWEVDTCRGHFNNVTGCLFHPHQDLIISVGEDKTIRTWDLNKRTSVQSFRRESDRFWVIAAHPEINLFAAGHDSGVMVFKLERERPASSVYQNVLFYINKEKQLRAYDFGKNAESLPLLSLKKLGNPWTPPRSLSYNPAERAILVTSPTDNGIYELIRLPRDATGAVEPTDAKRGTGNSAVFIARNRFAVFTKSSQTIEVKDLSNATTKTIKSPLQINDIHYGGTGCLLLFAQSSVVLYDIHQNKTLAELSASGVKYATWSNDGLHVALLGKHTITVATKTLELVTSLHETIRIKSATWDDSGVLVYSTLNHIKYTLLNGDNGIIKTLESTLYLIKIKGPIVYSLDRSGKVLKLQIDPTEFRFKKALVSKNYEEMLRIIKNSNLVGQSIISYLQKKGFPEIALQFVQDPQTRFDLAIECGKLDVALEMAKELDRSKLWTTLANEALGQGNHEIVELAYQKLRNFDKLSFLYLITGDKSKLERMSKIADHRSDYKAKFQNSLFLNNLEERIQVLRDVDLPALAYTTAKANGLEELAQEILESAGLTEDQVRVPELGPALAIPEVKVETFKSKVPLQAKEPTFFEKVLSGQVESLSLEDKVDVVKSSSGFGGFADDEVTEDVQSEFAPRQDHDDLDEEDGAGWDLDEEFLDVNDEANDGGSGSGVGGVDGSGETDFTAASGTSEADLWVRNSPVAADHVAAGSFDSAMQLLNRQVGIVNFAPLKARFLEVYQASKVYLPANEGLPALTTYVRRTKAGTESRQWLPVIARTLAHVSATDLQDAYKLVRTNKLQDAVTKFRNILYDVLVSAVESKSDADEAQQLIEIAREYILGLSIELERRSLPESDVKRNLELAAYFTKAKLQSVHVHNALQVAMTQSFKHKNFASAALFASRYLELFPASSSGPKIDQARKVKAKAESIGTDAIRIDYDQYAEFDICAGSHVPIYAGQSFVQDPFTQAKYLPEFKGKVCRISKVSAVGAPASGLRLVAGTVAA